jgi:hypothetical protein
VPCRSSRGGDLSKGNQIPGLFWSVVQTSTVVPDPSSMGTPSSPSVLDALPARDFQVLSYRAAIGPDGLQICESSLGPLPVRGVDATSSMLPAAMCEPTPTLPMCMGLELHLQRVWPETCISKQAQTGPHIHPESSSPSEGVQPTPPLDLNAPDQ